MEVSVLNIKGTETGRKVSLNDAIYAIEPNDHAIYLDVKLYLANQRQGTAKAKERSEMSGSTRKLGRQKGGGGVVEVSAGAREVVGVLVVVISTRQYWLVVLVCLVLSQEIMVSN